MSWTAGGSLSTRQEEIHTGRTNRLHTGRPRPENRTCNCEKIPEFGLNSDAGLLAVKGEFCNIWRFSRRNSDIKRLHIGLQCSHSHPAPPLPGLPGKCHGLWSHTSSNFFLIGLFEDARVHLKYAVRRTGLSIPCILRNMAVQYDSSLGARPLHYAHSYIHIRTVLKVRKPNSFDCTLNKHFCLCIYGLHGKLLRI